MMQPNRSSKPFDSGHRPGRLLLSVGFPLLLVLAFLGKQLINLDSIGWSNGFNHPLMGWDHLVTMLAVGVWAAQLRGQAIWMLPLAFVGVMSLGGLAGAAGLAIPSVEGIILLSCAVFSVLITRKVRFSAQINVLIVAFFAFFHGFAHGQEISASASLISYTLGFMLATLLLHGAGILVAKLVVFAIASLLTIVFSSVALAKNAESLLEQKDKPAVLAQDFEYANTPNFRLTLGRGYRIDIELTASSTDLGGAAASAAVVVGHGAKVPASDAGLLKVADGESIKLVYDTARSGDLSLGFRHYFPDINHTPGKQLLSNGVGLTSPPLAKPVPAPQVSQKPRKTLIPSIEEPSLQSIFAQADTGKSISKTSYPYWHDCAVRNPCHSVFSHHLTPIAGSSRSGNPALSVIAQLHPLPARPERLLAAMSETGRLMRISRQHNNKNQCNIKPANLRSGLA